VIKKAVIIVDFKGVLQNTHVDVLNRHIRYANLLQKYSDGTTKLIILTRSNLNLGNNSENYLESIVVPMTGRNPFAFVTLAKKLVGELEFSEQVFVSGDPWLNGLCAVLLKGFFAKNSKVQVQVHADIGKKGWRTESLSNLLRYCVASLILRFADQIRCVSKPQANNVINSFSISEDIVVVYPIPIDIPNKSVTRKYPAAIGVIGFVGRLEKDRGTELFAKTINKIKSSTPVSLCIVGEGKERESLINLINKENLTKLVFLGHLDKNEIESAWEEIDVLVVTAKFESYGMALREALIRSIPVLCTSTSGSEELIRQFEGEGIEVLSREDDSRSIAVKYRKLRECKVSPVMIANIKQESKNSSMNMVINWEKLFQNNPGTIE
jgi:glycosyltransferase involved in cell wall biosynthesis